MNRTQQDHSAGFALGVLAGAVVGAGVALLFAPKSGAALRSNIAESVEPLRAAIATRYQDLADRAGVEIENLHDTVDSATEVLEKRASAAVQTAARKLRSVDPTV
jgi:gas vesicle protein